ncbi:MAG: cobyrinate a,c-diamide synthase [Oscillospiraceae bacterium]|nr:cobyrinate a,c-diamide synthase [Oscillospiraceae bacterium]
MHSPRLVFAAPSSGSGKTTVTCGILQALKNRGMNVFSFKCGPDYIDPMFQEKVIGVRSGTLDLFFSGEDTLKRLFCRNAEGSDISVVEGVMGFYDGLGSDTDKASTYHVAKVLQAPVILIVNARGQALSALAELDGFMKFRPDSGIRGVIFNQMSEHVFKALEPEVRRMGILPIGYLPKVSDLVIESRHLGLVTPGEIDDLSDRLQKLAETLEKTLDFEALLKLAAEAPDLAYLPDPDIPDMPRTKIAVAKDEAFCFLYKDNLALLESLGAELLYFSPIHGQTVPDEAQGLLLPGGYPELYAKEISENVSMCESVAAAIQNGMPCLAECGGFLYLHKELEDMDGTYWPMTGVLDAKAWRTNRLGRFGYITLASNGDNWLLPEGEQIRAHEFHYYESGDCGTDLHAQKPTGSRSWDCIHIKGNLMAGFPHMFYESNPKFVERFLRRCAGEEE